MNKLFFPQIDFFYFARSSPPKAFLGKGVLKICSKFTEEHPYQSAILIKLQSNFIEITLRHGCSPVNLLHILGTPFPKNTSEGCFCFAQFDLIQVQEALKTYSICEKSMCYIKFELLLLINYILNKEINQKHELFKRQPHKMVKDTQTICRLLPTNY